MKVFIKFYIMKVCISRPCAPNEIIDIESFPDITIEEFSKIVKLPNKTFSIKTPFFREKLDNNIQPFIIYPDLVIKNEEILKYPIPDICLMINEVSQAEYSLFVLISTQLENIEFPKMEVEIKLDDLDKWTSKDFLSKCIETFSYPCSETLLLNSNQEKINEDVPMKELYNISKKSYLTFQCKVEESSLEKINKRKHVVEEIIQSEITYVKNIETLESYFYTAFQNSEIFDRFQLKVIFREIKPIIKTHLELIREEAKIKAGYNSVIGPIFLNFIDRFKVAIPFVINFKHVDEMIQKKRFLNKHNEKKYQEISSKNPNQEGGDFNSYYIMPVQRYPRYTLLIRDLDKCTPSFHPDKQYLTLAKESLIIFNREIDETTQKVKQLLILGEIQKNLPNTFTIVSSERQLIMKKKVSLHQKLSIKKGIIYLFSDMILIVKKGNKKLNPIVFTEIEKFRFYNGFPQNDSILINNKDTEITITFENYEDRIAFIEQLNVTRTIHLSTIKCESKFIKWTEVELGSVLVPLMNHDGCLLNNKVYFFGGTNSSLMNCSALIEYDLVTNKWKLKSSPVQSRVGHTMTNVVDKVYICFGFNKNEYFSDIWEYDGNRWKVIVLSTKIEIAFHSTVCYDNKLVVFGGKNEHGYSNSLYIIDPATGHVTTCNESKNSPYCRSNHSAVVLNNKMVVIGGETDLLGNKILGEVHVFDFKLNSWTWMNNADVQPRINHRAVVLKGFIFVIGGSNKYKAKSDNANSLVGRSSEMLVVKNECIDPLLWKKVDFKEFGNCPLGLSNFAISPTSNTSAVTFGGIDLSTKLPFASSWTFDIEEGFFQT